MVYQCRVPIYCNGMDSLTLIVVAGASGCQARDKAESSGSLADDGRTWRGHYYRGSRIIHALEKAYLQKGVKAIAVEKDVGRIKECSRPCGEVRVRRLWLSSACSYWDFMAKIRG